MVARTIDNTLVAEIVRRIVDDAHPDKIVLFGSYARGDATEQSDIDLLVVVPDGVPRRECAVSLYERLAGIGIPKDIVVVHASDVVRYANVPGTVITPALHEGKVLYDATA